MLRQNLQQRLAFALASLFAAGSIAASALPSLAQFSLPDNFSKSENIGPPPEVTRYGNIETSVVNSPLSNRTLFTIASPTAYNRNPNALGDQQTVEQRVQEIQAKLLLLLKRPMDPKTLVFDVSTLRNIPVIIVNDEQYPRPLILVSVTEYDAEFNGQTLEKLAIEWRKILEKELRTGLENVPSNKRKVARILIGLFVLTIVLVLAQYLVFKCKSKLRRKKSEIDATSATESQLDHPEKSVEIQTRRKNFSSRLTLQRIFNLERQLTILDWSQWLLFWSLFFIWLGGYSWIDTVSPYMTNSQLQFLEIPINLLIVWFLTGLAIRLSCRLIEYFTKTWKERDLEYLIDQGGIQRRQIRVATISRAVQGFFKIIIIFTGLLAALSAIGLPTTSIVAVGSLAGLAITFGSQNLIKDLVNGFFILAEDQYAIGDTIALDQASGLVENLNLRVTQIRGENGELVTIQNSKIIRVNNLTRTWSRVNFSIDVAYQTDPDQALKVLKDVSQNFYNDPDWQDHMLSAPTVLGIDHLSHCGMTITTWIQTAPAQQWSVGREFRLRVRRALAEHGIDIGIPRQVYALESTEKSTKKKYSHVNDDNENVT